MGVIIFIADFFALYNKIFVVFVTFLKLYVELVERCEFTFLNIKKIIRRFPEISRQFLVKCFRSPSNLEDYYMQMAFLLAGSFFKGIV